MVGGIAAIIAWAAVFIGSAWFLSRRIAQSFQGAPYRDSYLDRLVADLESGRASGISGGGVTEAIGQPVRSGSHSHDGEG
jgi:hypothetical protein